MYQDMLDAAQAGNVPAMQASLAAHGKDALEARDPMRRTPLLLAADFQRRDAVKWLLEQGADTSAVGTLGGGAMVSAAFLGDVAMAQLLVDHGANVDACDSRGWTPFLIAVTCNNSTLAEWLEDNGACANACTATGQTAASLAVSEEMKAWLTTFVRTS